MGKWNLLPADSEGWHTERTSRFFKKIFGFGKGTFIVQTFEDDMQHAYFPKFYIQQIYNFIRDANKKDYLKLARILKGFYRLRKIAKRAVPRISSRDFRKLSNNQIIRAYQQNRYWANRVACYDQFGWIAEDYWAPIMDRLLARYGLKKGSPEFLRVLFILTKPEEISTTLEEKRAVLHGAIQVKQGRQSITSAAKKLAQQYGWLPCFAYGTPWDERHYLTELNELRKKSLSALQGEWRQLKNYTKTRNNDLRSVVQKCGMKEKDLQIFIDFGLALDARNEAEYIMSLCGFGLIPIYTEIARRLFLSIKQVRHLTYEEIILAVQGRIDPIETLARKGKIIGWVFDRTMTKKKYLYPREAARFFKYLGKHAKNLQGNDEAKGICGSPGKAVGRAKIMHYPKDATKVKNGDILIVHATTVDYLPAMKKAAAYVTEVGGLTCHAAVVAREFGVPCIVSLKNATKNFKDGDMVEVDANIGVVKKQ